MSKKRYFIARARLVRYLRQHWDDTHGWLVYGDLLQERGDPRGELIAIENTLRDTKPRTGLEIDGSSQGELESRRDAVRQRLLGELAAWDGLQCRWEWAAVRHASVEVSARRIPTRGRWPWPAPGT